MLIVDKTWCQLVDVFPLVPSSTEVCGPLARQSPLGLASSHLAVFLIRSHNWIGCSIASFNPLRIKKMANFL